MKLINWLKTLFRRKIYRTCLCIKHAGKWREVKTFSHKNKTIEFIVSYYNNGETLCYYVLNDVNFQKCKFRIKRVVIGYVN